MSFFSDRPQENSTIVALLASAIRRDIAFGTLEPDSRLPLEVLKTRYGGSANSIREALRILTAEGLVEAEAQRGFRVVSASEADLVDVMRLRLEIERLALAWSIEAGDLSWEGRVVAAHHALRKREQALNANIDDLKALEWDDALRLFHAALAAACGSPRLITLQQQFFDQSRRFMLASLRERRLDVSYRLAIYEKLVAAVMERDVGAAVQNLDKILKIERA